MFQRLYMRRVRRFAQFALQTVWLAKGSRTGGRDYEGLPQEPFSSARVQTFCSPYTSISIFCKNSDLISRAAYVMRALKTSTAWCLGATQCALVAEAWHEGQEAVAKALKSEIGVKRKMTRAQALTSFIREVSSFFFSFFSSSTQAKLLQACVETALEGRTWARHCKLLSSTFAEKRNSFFLSRVLCAPNSHANILSNLKNDSIAVFRMCVVEHASVSVIPKRAARVR